MINIICMGKIKEKYLNDLIDDYTKRISKYHKLNIIELPDNDMDTETKNILKHIKPNDYVISLAIEGKQLDSVELSNLIDKTFINYPIIDFIIGESNGLSDEIKNRSNMLLSFSKLTYPHGLFRGILLEQIYRSFKILNNESYHK
ncbi:MAG: 23S rRNA (pseudouridine(1915)-N(3))-methyltransferase RlmH [Firmicutes bacterium]|nr:23S rRNA (pseudouridine(1915)-N(3))-methyltransferase RlmH [Bacillota bacterium]